MYSHIQLRTSFCLECSEEPPEGLLRAPVCLISVTPFAFPTLAKVWKVTKQMLFEKFCSVNLVYSISRIPPSSFPLHARQELGWKHPSRCVDPPRGRTQQALSWEHLLIIFLQFLCIVKIGRRKSIVSTPDIYLPLSGIFLLSLRVKVEWCFGKTRHLHCTERSTDGSRKKGLGCFRLWTDFIVIASIICV